MDNFKRFDAIMDGVFGGGTYNVDPNNYPMYLESTIQRAVSHKRNGEYDKAIDIYLDIFESTRRVYPAIMEFLYKVVLCSGELEFAYQVIVYAEIFAKKCWGTQHQFFGEWSQTSKRKEFERVLLETNKYQASIITNGELSKSESDKLLKNFLKKTELINELAKKYSGNPDYRMGLVQDSSFQKCYALYNDFHRLYGKLLDA